MKQHQQYESITSDELARYMLTTNFIQIDDNSGIASTAEGDPRDIFDVHKFAETVIDHDDIPAFNLTYDNKGQFIGAKPTVIGKALDKLKHALSDYDKRYGSCHEYIACVLKTMRDYDFSGFHQFAIAEVNNNEALAKYVNSFVDELRKRLNNDYLQMRVANRYKNAYKNFISGRDYVDELFNCYSKLNVIRIELGYKYQPNGIAVPIEEAQRDIKALLAQVKKHPAFEHCVGYLGKIEFGYDKGYHFSFIFLFDGSKVNKDFYRCGLIGKLWCNEINPEFGTYHNCNRNKAEYKAFNGIGMVHYDDLKKRENLVKHVIGYVTKSEQMVMVKPGKRDRVFFRGRIPKHVREQKAGRPRKQLRLQPRQLMNIDSSTGEILH